MITDAPKTLQQGQTFTITVDNANVIQKLELIKFGNATHSFDAEQRAFSLQFTHVDAHTLRVTLPANANTVTDGYWMLFADNNNGTPSVAATIKIGQVGVDTSAPNIAGTNLMLNGTASHVYGSNVYTLNTDNGGQVGSVMSDKRIDLTHDFDLSFSLLMGNKANGADGMAFVLHNDAFGANALGGGGGGLGAGGLRNGLAIQFDTYQNVNQGDIAAPHTDFVTTDPGAATYRLESPGRSQQLDGWSVAQRRCALERRDPDVHLHLRRRPGRTAAADAGAVCQLLRRLELRLLRLHRLDRRLERLASDPGQFPQCDLRDGFASRHATPS